MVAEASLRNGRYRRLLSAERYRRVPSNIFVSETPLSVRGSCKFIRSNPRQPSDVQYGKMRAESFTVAG